LVEGIFFAALLHDIGKIAVLAEILSRPGNLQPEDRSYLKTHCLKGYEMVKEIEFPWLLQNSSYVCPDCGAVMVVTGFFDRKPWSRAPPRRIDDG
jgi:hypothetical protein